MDQKFTVRLVDGDWLVEGDCIDKESVTSLFRVHELLDISMEQMLYNEIKSSK